MNKKLLLMHTLLLSFSLHTQELKQQKIFYQDAQPYIDTIRDTKTATEWLVNAVKNPSHFKINVSYSSEPIYMHPYKAIVLLLQKGADPFMLHKSNANLGVDSVACAIRNGFSWEIIRLLLGKHFYENQFHEIQKEADGKVWHYDAFHVAFKSKRYDILTQLFKEKYPIRNIKVEKNNKSFDVSIFELCNDSSVALNSLILLGADPTAIDHEGKTVLHHYIQNKFPNLNFDFIKSYINGIQPLEKRAQFLSHQDNQAQTLFMTLAMVSLERKCRVDFQKELEKLLLPPCDNTLFLQKLKV